MENGNMNGLQKEKITNLHKNARAFLYTRWLIAVVILLQFLFVSKDTVSNFIFFETLAVVVVYNVLTSIYSSNSYKSGKRSSPLLIYSDVIFISVFIYQLGGLNSDLFIIYLFLIGYCGVYANKNLTIGVSITCILIYTAVCLISLKNTAVEIDIWRLAIRDFLMIFAGYGITFVGYEVKRFNELHKKEFKLARTDKLTGLANRHYFEQKIGEELEYSDSTGMPLNVLIFDLDNFKKFNDSYGHVWGDKLLGMFSDIIKQNIRKSDIPIRFGGEEFMLLLRDLELEAAKDVGDRIRKQLESQKIYVGNDTDRKRVTVSCGVAQYPKHSNEIKTVVDLADKALYYAKGTGKNRVVSFEEIKEKKNIAGAK